MNEKMREKRDVLKILSGACVQLAEGEGLNLEEHTINSLIMRYAYNLDFEYNFKSFAGWKNDGYTIKKGSKAYIVWGQPVSTKREELKEKKEEDQAKEDSFFPVAYIFRNDQVVKPLRKITPTIKTAIPIVVEDLPL